MAVTQIAYHNWHVIHRANRWYYPSVETAYKIIWKIGNRLFTGILGPSFRAHPATSASFFVISPSRFPPTTPLYLSSTPLALHLPGFLSSFSLSITVFNFSRFIPFAFMAEHDLSPLSRKGKGRYSFFLPRCCFQHRQTAAKPRMLRSQSHLKEKYNSFISRIGRHRRRHSADFHYDALSYALNFEDDAATDDQYYYGSFSARYPPLRSLSTPSPLRYPEISPQSVEIKCVSGCI